MTIATAVAIVSIIATVASTVSAIQGAKQQKKAAGRRAELERERLAIQQQQANLEEARERSRLRRTSRAARAALANRAAASNVLFTSTFTGAQQAIGTNVGREINFVSETFENTAQANLLTGQQIEANRAAAEATAESRITGAVIGGIADIAGQTAENLPLLEDVFGTETVQPATSPR